MNSFPVDALPRAAAEFARQAAASLDCPPELVGLPVLCALSGAMGYTRELHIKQGWSTSGSLYAAIVDEPGSRKSPAQSMAYKPLQILQVELRKDYKKRKEVHEQEMREHAVEKKKAAKDDRPEPEPPKLQKMQRCIVDDITIEALAMRLEENPRGFLSAHDELSGFIRGMDQYKSGGKGNTRQSYLKIWSNIAIYVDRKGSDEPVIIPSPFVTLQGAIQPDVLHEISGGRNDGFLDRFLFAYPSPHAGGYSEETVATEVEVAYQNLIGGLWKKHPYSDADGDPYPRGVEMDHEAKQMFIAAARSFAAEASSPGFPTALKGPWAKFDTHLARLALIIAVARCVDEEEERVIKADMRAALALVEYFKSTAKKVYGEVFESNPDDALAADISTFLTSRGNKFFGTITKLMEEIPSVVPSVVLPDTPQGMGRALARIVERTPLLELARPARADDRNFRLTLKKTSETSETSAASPEDEAKRYRDY